MPRDLGDLHASITRMPNAIREAEAKGVKDAAIKTANLIRTEIRGVTGDMRLSGVGKKGAPVGASADPNYASTPEAPAWEVKATGPLHLIERDTAPHPIYPKGMTFSTTRRGNVRRRGKTRALKFGDGFAAYADHPGTSGKRPFAKGVAKARPLVPLIIKAELDRGMMRAWLGGAA